MSKPNIIAIANHRRGSGKTTASVNIATAISKVLTERGLSRNSIKGDVLVVDPTGHGAMRYVTDSPEGFESIPLPFGADTSGSRPMIAYVPDMNSLDDVIRGMQYVIIDTPGRIDQELTVKCIEAADSVMVSLGESASVTLKRQLAETLAFISAASEHKEITPLDAIIQNGFLSGSSHWEEMDRFLTQHYPNSTFNVSHNPRVMKSSKVGDIALAWSSLTASSEYMKIAKSILDNGATASVLSIQRPRKNDDQTPEQTLQGADDSQPHETPIQPVESYARLLYGLRKPLATFAVAASIIGGIVFAGPSGTDNAEQEMTMKSFAFHDVELPSIKSPDSIDRKVAIARVEMPIRRKMLVPGVYANRKIDFSGGALEAMKGLIFGGYVNDMRNAEESSFTAGRWDKTEKVEHSFASTAMFAQGAKGRPHHAYDYPVLDDGDGQPVTPIAKGTLIVARWMGGCGWGVEVDYGNGLRSRMCHLQKLPDYVTRAVGKNIYEDFVLGYVGDTGIDDYGNKITVGRPHLHVKLFDGRTPVRAEYFLNKLNQ